MNRIRWWAVGTLLIAAITISAQPLTAMRNGAPQEEHGRRAAQDGVPTVEQQMKALTAKLDLTGDQQDKFKPILQELHDATLKIVHDESLSQQERLSKVRPYRYEARDKMRAVLNDDQKKKLDEYLQGPHSEMHGSLSGNPSSPAQSPQN